MGGKNERKDGWLDQLLHWLEKHKTFTGTVVIFSRFCYRCFNCILVALFNRSRHHGDFHSPFCVDWSKYPFRKKELTTGEVRRAIAISCTSVFFGLLAFGETDSGILNATLENFWWIIVAIIGFYFGGRSAERIVENITEKWTKKLEGRVEKLERKVYTKGQQEGNKQQS